jgi:non-canonical (house-cleaning) NTP pyrophosphatase
LIDEKPSKNIKYDSIYESKYITMNPININTVTIWHATNNPHKVNAVNNVLKNLYPSGDYRIDHVCQPIKLQEGLISSQPLGDDETKLGSQIRAREIKINGTADINIRVGVEGGLVIQNERNLADVTYVTLLIGDHEYIGQSDPLQVRDPQNQNKLYTLSEVVMKRLEGLNELQRKNIIRFGHADGEDALNREGFQVNAYRQEIVEPLLFQRKIDLYAYYSEGKISREAVVTQAAERAMQAYFQSSLISKLSKN